MIKSIYTTTLEIQVPVETNLIKSAKFNELTTVVTIIIVFIILLSFLVLLFIFKRNLNKKRQELLVNRDINFQNLNFPIAENTIDNENAKDFVSIDLN